MDQPNEDNKSERQSTNHSLPINNPSLPLETGQQASILLGGQSFLILSAGQAASSRQDFGLNVLPVGAPDASFLQTSEPQEQIIQVGGVHPDVSQIDEHKPFLNQTESVPSNLEQIHGLQPPAIQLDHGAQPQIIQANEIVLEPSQCIMPGATTLQVGGLLSSLAKDGVSALQTPVPNIRDNIRDFQSVSTKIGEDVPLLTQTGRAQPNITTIGGLVSSSVKVKAETEPLPINKIAVHSTHAFHPVVSQPPGPRPPLNQTKKFRPILPRNPSIHIPTETELSHVEIKTEPGLENAEIKLLTIKASGHYAEKANMIYFPTPPALSSQFNPSPADSAELQPSAVQESAKYSTLTKKTKKSRAKKGLKTQQSHSQSTDDARSTYKLIKFMHAYTNISKKIKSIGTQAKMLLKSRNQAVQFPENNYEGPTYQECGTQSEESYWPGQADFQESGKPLPYKVVIVRDPEPESVSLFFSETSQGDGDYAQNMEEVEKSIHDSIEVEHPHFDDVAVYFTEDEWACLNNAEKNLYRRVMMDNYWNLVSVGKISITPPLISKIERGQEPYMRSQQQTDCKRSSYFDSKDDSLIQKVSNDVYNVDCFCERLNQITYPIKLSMSGLTVTRIMSDSSFSDPSPAARAEDWPRDPGKLCPFRSLLKEKPLINENPFRCFECKGTFKSFESLRYHFQKMHINGDNFACTYCGRKFPKLKMLLLHFMVHTGDRPFVCSGCGKTFTSQVCLKNHYGLNAAKKLCECTECGQQFPLKLSLLKHEKLHREDPNNACVVCGKKFAHKASLLFHEKTHSSHSFCPICGQYFSQREDCAQHMLEHSPSELFACAECGNTFIYERQLVEHQKLHQNEYIDLASPDIVVKVEEEG